MKKPRFGSIAAKRERIILRVLREKQPLTVLEITLEIMKEYDEQLDDDNLSENASLLHVASISASCGDLWMTGYIRKLPGTLKLEIIKD